MSETNEIKLYWVFDHALGGYFCPICGKYMPHRDSHGAILDRKDNKYCYNCGARIYIKEE